MADGDAERKITIGARFGATNFPLRFRWFRRFQPVGEELKIDLKPGDLYFMCEKAVGRDWLKSKIYTLRHAAGRDGCAYIKLKKKRAREE